MSQTKRTNGDDARLVAALARGVRLVDAADEAGISARTAQRRWSDPAFRRRVADAQDGALAAAAGVLSDGAVDAAAHLVAVARGDDVSTPQRIAAARYVLQLVLPLADAMNVSARLSDLEDWRASERRDVA